MCVCLLVQYGIYRPEEQCRASAVCISFRRLMKKVLTQNDPFLVSKIGKSPPF